MKSERGVTIASVIIYVVALTFVVILIGRVTTYFYRNINMVTDGTNANQEYTKFNSHFTNEINIQENKVILCENSYIVFEKTKNQYTYQNGSIYRNKSKICENIDNCEFSYDDGNGIITVNITILGKNYNNTYTVTK